MSKKSNTRIKKITNGDKIPKDNQGVKPSPKGGKTVKVK
jgi:hypothetical protein